MLAKATLSDGSGLSVRRVMLSQPRPGTAWGELSFGKWVEGPWPERGASLDMDSRTPLASPGRQGFRAARQVGTQALMLAMLWRDG